MKTIIKYHILSLLISFSVFFVGCIKENLGNISVNEDDGDEIEFTINYKASGLASIATKGVVLDDNKMATLKANNGYLIAYEVKSDGTEVFAYYRNFGNNRLADDIGTGSFKVKLAKSKAGEKYTFDFLFNVDYSGNLSFQTQYDNGTFKRGITTRQEIREKLYYQGIPIIMASSYLPMWGTFPGPMGIDHGTTFPELNLMRSYALIDVGLNFNENDVAQGLDNFELTFVHVVNICQRRYYMADPDNIVNGVSVAPSCYLANSVNNANQGVSVTNDFIMGSLFTGEMAGNQPANSNPMTTPCVVLRGKYKYPDGTVSSDFHYYRVDLVDPNDPSKKLDWLRNHRYRINILGIDGPSPYTGATFAVANNAGANPAINVRYELTVQGTEGKINHVVYNGQYFLGVSDAALYFEGGNSASNPGSLKIKTNVSTGWKLESVVDEQGNTPDWITFAKTNGNHTTVHDVDFTMTQNVAEPRVAYATFSAGPLTIKVQIVQNGTWLIGSDYDGRMLLGDGDQSEIWVWGNVPPKVYVRAFNEENNLIVSRTELEFSGNGTAVPQNTPLTADLHIVGNAYIPNKIRQVQFQYSLDGIND